MLTTQLTQNVNDLALLRLPLCGNCSSTLLVRRLTLITLSSLHCALFTELKVDLKLGMKFLRGVCHGMAYLHTLEPLIPHMDLNSHHIFVSPMPLGSTLTYTGPLLLSV